MCSIRNCLEDVAPYFYGGVCEHHKSIFINCYWPYEYLKGSKTEDGIRHRGQWIESWQAFYKDFPHGGHG